MNTLARILAWVDTWSVWVWVVLIVVMSLGFYFLQPDGYIPLDRNAADLDELRERRVDDDE